MDKEPINRLFLVGNGFDLAHGMKTRYNDFILQYMSSCFKYANEHNEYDDPLIKVERLSYIPMNNGYLKAIPEYVQHFYIRGFKGIEDGKIYFNDSLKTSITNPYKVRIHSEFFRRLLSRCSNANWVEIENEYYTILKEILHSEKLDKRSTVLEDLHTRFRFLIVALEEYLLGLPLPEPIEGYNNIFDSPILDKDIVSDYKIEDSQLPEETLILNFNYTPTLNRYFPPAKFVSLKDHKRINYIHGELRKFKNPMIFGYGDELDKDYEKMELETTKGFFTYIKSFWYFKTSNYHNLIRFIDSAKFQVCVLGHSCGLSDRTMLNMIFENANCISIKIYYHGDEHHNNFTEITQEISRHFKDKPGMRRKIVSFDKSEPMPQASAES